LTFFFSVGLLDFLSFPISFSGKKGVTLLDTHGGGDFFFPDTTSSFVKHLASVPSQEEGQSTSQQNEEERRNQLTGRRSLLPSSLDNNNNNSSNNKPAANSLSPAGAAAPVGGLVALAKAGRISKAQNLFDVEVNFASFFRFQFLHYFCLDNWKRREGNYCDWR
jgi:hypothetical protein